MGAFISKGSMVLRPVRPEDGMLFLKWHNDQNLRESIGGAFPFTERTFSDICNRGNTETPANVWFAAEWEGHLIGIAGLHNIKYIQRNAEIALLIGEWENRQKGYGTAILESVSRYGFQDLGLHRLYAQIYPHNTASIQLFQKSGFQREGILREASWWNGRFRDIIIYGKLDSQGASFLCG